MDAALASNSLVIHLMHHPKPSGVYQLCRIGMMHECSPGELLMISRAAFMNHADKGQAALIMYYAALTQGYPYDVRTCIV